MHCTWEGGRKLGMDYSLVQWSKHWSRWCMPGNCSGTHLHESRKETLLPWATTSCDLSVLASKLVIGSAILLLLTTSFVRVSHILKVWMKWKVPKLFRNTLLMFNMHTGEYTEIRIQMYNNTTSWLIVVPWSWLSTLLLLHNYSSAIAATWRIGFANKTICPYCYSWYSFVSHTE